MANGCGRFWSWGPGCERRRPGVNVLFVIAEFRPKRAGAELQAERLALALAGQGIGVEILTCQMKGTQRSERVGNVTISRLPAFGPDRYWLLGLVPSVFRAVLARRNRVD